MNYDDFDEVEYSLIKKLKNAAFYDPDHSNEHFTEELVKRGLIKSDFVVQYPGSVISSHEYTVDHDAVVHYCRVRDENYKQQKGTRTLSIIALVVAGLSLLCQIASYFIP